LVKPSMLLMEKLVLIFENCEHVSGEMAQEHLS
jgi:hypothetical protein